MTAETIDTNSVNALLPKGYCWQQQNIALCYCGGKEVMPLCNFVPVPTNVSADGRQYQIDIFRGDGVAGITAQISLPFKVKMLCELYPQLTLHPVARNANRHLSYVIAHMLSRWELPILNTITSLGMTEIDGVAMYVAGDTVLSPKGIVKVSNCQIVEDVRCYCLEIEPRYSEKELVDKMLMTADILPEVTFPLVASFLLGISLSLFRDAGLIADFWLCLVGRSEMYKTSLAEFCTCLYNRSLGFSSCSDGFTSTYAALDGFLHQFNDTTVVLDDLCKSDNKRMMDEQTDLVCRLQRAHTNNTPRRKVSGKQTVGSSSHSFVVTTAERYLTAYSTASRMLTVDVTQKCDLNKLRAAQEDPLALSSFAARYIPYLLRNRNSIIAKVRMRVHTPIDERLSQMSIRISNHCKALKTALDIFLEYGLEVGGIDAETAAAVRKYINNLFDQIAQKNIQRLEKTDQARDYQFGKVLAQNLERFSFGYSKDDLHHCAGVVLRGEYFLLPISAVNLMREHFNDGKITDIAMNKRLANQGLIHLDKSGNNTKKRCGIRMLHLNIEELNKLRGNPFPERLSAHEDGYAYPYI